MVFISSVLVYGLIQLYNYQSREEREVAGSYLNFCLTWGCLMFVAILGSRKCFSHGSQVCSILPLGYCHGFILPLF